MLVENILIKKVGEVQSGTSQATGEEWANRCIILGWEDETGNSYINAIVDEGVWQQLGHKEGDTVSLNLRFRTRPLKSNFIVNDVRIIKTAPSNSPKGGEINS